MHIKRSDDVPSFAQAHGEVVAELIGVKMGNTSRHSLAQITLPFGKSSRPHYHPEAEESFYILAGHGQIVMNGETQPIHAGDSILIPAGVTHHILNDSSTREHLIFLAVCVPAWTPDNSIYLEP
ncbi:MAG: cupin domain-containing protein [Phototrophicaceae bacterium]|jgi:mannose-6-phosphate isomerase-like protein (cupin superfamily)